MIGLKQISAPVNNKLFYKLTFRRNNRYFSENNKNKYSIRFFLNS